MKPYDDDDEKITEDEASKLLDIVTNPEQVEGWEDDQDDEKKDGE